MKFIKETTVEIHPGRIFAVIYDKVLRAHTIVYADRQLCNTYNICIIEKLFLTNLEFEQIFNSGSTEDKKVIRIETEDKIMYIKSTFLSGLCLNNEHTQSITANGITKIGLYNYVEEVGGFLDYKTCEE